MRAGTQKGTRLELPLLAVCLGLALYFRLEMRDAAVMGSDSIGPYAKAYQILTWKNLFPRGPFPESGYLAPYSFVPYLLPASSLRAALTLRFCWNALLILPLYWGLSRAARPSAPGLAIPFWLIALLFMAMSPGLADTLLTGYQTFDAPAYACIVALGALLICFRQDARGAWLVFPFLPVLAMLHPLAIIYAAASLWLAWLLWRMGARKTLAKTSALALIIAIPQLYRYIQAGQGKPGAILTHLWEIAHSPGQFDSLGAVLVKAVDEELLIRDLFPHVALVFAPLACLLLVPALRRRLDPDEQPWVTGVMRFAIWTLGMQLALIAMAALIRYLQPYHLRLLYPALAAQLAMALAALALLLRPRVRRLEPSSPRPTVADWIPALLLCVVLAVEVDALFTHRFPPPPIDRGTLAIHEQISKAVRPRLGPRPVVLEMIHLSNNMIGYPPAIVLDLLLSGTPESAFLSRPEDVSQSRFLMALTGGPALLLELTGASEGHPDAAVVYTSPEGDLQLVALDGVGAARAWSRRICTRLPSDTPIRYGGANDYLGWFNLEHDTNIHEQWLDGCLRER